ncbi:MAG: leucine--tRNA ligase [Vulcanimicrobiota bacterium]
MSSHRYQPSSLEPKWQNYWLEHKTFRTPNPGDPDFDSAKPKYYVLDMFPYPSGAGLHVGHPEGYTATDILARFKRMRGFNVMHPMGWDAFGLPAEQYAVQTGTHPSITTRANIETFRRQIQSLGFSYDWDREISTTHPAYVRWTQWIFALLYETWFDESQGKGRPIAELPIPEGLTPSQKVAYVNSKRLAYIDEMAVWWCSALGTVLANEEVIDGKSERGNHPCMRLPLRQWMLRITAYASRLLRDLEEVEWPDETKKQQREWIGESQGAEVDFQVNGSDEKIRVFTTRPDTLYGATFMVLAPEHPLVTRLTSKEQADAVHDYVLKTASKSELERSANKEKTGVALGSLAINPVNGERIPIWISDYVLATYGTGAIMSVPGHDERDGEFARQFGLPIIQVVQPPEGFEGECFSGDGVAVNSELINGLPTPEAKKKIIAHLESQGKGKGKTQYRLRDWIFSRQRYWGEPFPIVHRQDGSCELVADAQLPVELPELEDFRPSGNPEPLLAKAREWLNTKDSAGKDALRETNTMPNWAGSCWYYLRFIDPRNPDKPWDGEREKYWMPVDLYVGGREHAVLHLLYARFWHKVLFDRGYVSTPEPFRKLFHQGMILGMAYEDAEKKLIPSDEVKEIEGGFEHNGKPVKQVVAKMSKSLKNVVNPDDILKEFGADSLRMYEMFMGPLEITKPWNTKDVGGVYRFLQRVWRLIIDEDTGAVKPAGDKEAPELERALHRCIKKVGDDIERMAFNTAVSAMMIFLNEASAGGAPPLTPSQRDRFVLTLAPFAPHLCEELWQRLGHSNTLAYEPFPGYAEEMLTDEVIEVPVQVNGKLRARLQVSPEIDTAELEKMARQAVAEWLEGKETKKVVVIPKRMVNLVV